MGRSLSSTHLNMPIQRQRIDGQEIAFPRRAFDSFGEKKSIWSLQDGNDWQT